jgi:hypothetical protein
MSKLEMNIPHQLDQQEAVNRIQTLLKRVEAQFGNQVQNLQQDWNGNEGKFSFTVMNMPISGTLKVNQGDVSLDSQLPMAAAMFSGKIKSVIMEEAKKVLS